MCGPENIVDKNVLYVVGERVMMMGERIFVGGRILLVRVCYGLVLWMGGNCRERVLWISFEGGRVLSVRWCYGLVLWMGGYCR